MMVLDGLDGSFDEVSIAEAYLTACGVKQESHKALLERFNRVRSQIISRSVNSSYSPENPAGSGGAYILSYDEVSRLLENSHKDLFKTYQFNALYPEDLLKTGVYNCVSSSAFFAAILDVFRTPVTFVFTYRHVFLRVPAEGKVYRVETTKNLGFDPGPHHYRENPDGSRKWAVKKNYSSMTEKTIAGFIASLYCDRRIMAKRAQNHVYTNYMMSAFGWALDNENKTLKNNFISSAVNLALEQLSAGKVQKADRETFAAYRLLDGFIDRDSQSDFEKVFVYILKYIYEKAPDQKDDFYSKLRETVSRNSADKIMRQGRLAAQMESPIDVADGYREFLAESGKTGHPDKKKFENRFLYTFQITLGNLFIKEGPAAAARYVIEVYDKSIHFQGTLKNYLPRLMFPATEKAIIRAGRIEKGVASVFDVIKHVSGGDAYKTFVSDIVGNAVIKTVRLNDYETAYAFSTNVFSLIPPADFESTFVFAAYKLGDSYLRQGDLFKAAEFFIQAKNDYPEIGALDDVVTAKLLPGLTDLVVSGHKDKVENVLALFGKQVRRSSDKIRFMVYYNASARLSNNGMYRQAWHLINDYFKILKKNPYDASKMRSLRKNYGVISYNLAVSLINKKHYGQAIELIERSLPGSGYDSRLQNLKNKIPKDY